MEVLEQSFSLGTRLSRIGFFFLYSSIAAPSFCVFFITGVFLTSELGLRVNF